MTLDKCFDFWRRLYFSSHERTSFLKNYDCVLNDIVATIKMLWAKNRYTNISASKRNININGLTINSSARTKRAFWSGNRIHNLFIRHSYIIILRIYSLQEYQYLQAWIIFVTKLYFLDNFLLYFYRYHSYWNIWYDWCA